METILSFDLGAAYFKASVFDSRMRLLATDRLLAEHGSSTPGGRDIASETFLRLLLQLNESMQQK